MDSFFTRTAEYSLLEEGIILCRILEKANIQPADIKENLEATHKLAGGKPYVALVDGRRECSVTREARELGARPESYQLQIAAALVVTSVSNRLIGNFIIRFYKPPVPTRLFGDMDSALDWLKSCMKQNKAKENGKGN